MKEQGTPIEPKQLVAATTAPPEPPDSRASQNNIHLAAVAAETSRLTAMDWPTLRAELRNVIAGQGRVSTETLVRICGQAHQDDDRPKLNLAFEAVSVTATPLLLAGARTLAPDERRDQAQQILLQLFEAIITGKARLAETFFAAFAKRRAVDLFRHRETRLESKLTRAEPVDDLDPIDMVSARAPSAENRALLSVAIDKLPPNHRAAFIQYHRLGMTQDEIADQHGVDVRTVRNWLKKAEETLGLQGEDNDC